MRDAGQDGYGVSTAYNYGYYRRLSPNWLRLGTAIHGVPFPEGDPFRYFELGFGQGVSLNAHAASNPGEFWGNDYNPQHLEFATAIAEASGANINLLGDSFEELAARDDLPQFHVIVAHGIWSWISNESIASILQFLDRYLAPGGLFYVSYNALPGSASGISLQRFLHSVSSSLDNSLSEFERFKLARENLRALKNQPGSHFDQYPAAMARLERILGETSPYILHEYTVGVWNPKLLLEVASQLAPLGLSYCGSANLNADSLAHRETSSDCEELLLKETVQDFYNDRSFRCDIFVRSNLARARGTTRQCIDNQEIALGVLPEEIELFDSKDTNGPDNQNLTRLLESLAGTKGARAKICDIARLDDSQTQGLVISALEAGLVYPVGRDCHAESIENSARLNHFLKSHPLQGRTKQLRVSPVLGTAIEFPEFDGSERDAHVSVDTLVSNLLAHQEDGSCPQLSAVEILRSAANHHSRLKLATALKIL